MGQVFSHSSLIAKAGKDNVALVLRTTELYFSLNCFDLRDTLVIRTTEKASAPLTNPMSRDVVVLTVATNLYIDYWKQMVQSAEQHLAPGSDLTFYVFTDQPDEARQFGNTLIRSNVVPIVIPSLGWPEATLLRYELFRDSWHLIMGEVVIHLDADMLFVSDTYLNPDPAEWLGGIALVRHPGFRRPRFSRLPKLYLAAPLLLVWDLKRWLRLGGLGDWEVSQDSLAYVPRKRRHTYVCGGTWMGLREPLGVMINELADRTRRDLQRGVVAIWHDESHLNWFASTHAHELLDSEKCYAEGHPNLEDLYPEIIAVAKDGHFTR